MNNVFKLEDHTGRYDAMMCSSREESDYFRRFLHENGKKWSSGNTYLDTDHYDDSSNENIFAFNVGLRGTGYDEHIDMGYNVLEFSAYDWPGFADPFIESESLNEFLGLFTNAMR